MIWAQKLAQKHTTAATWMRQARQKAANPKDGSTDDFLNKMGLGEADPSDQRTGLDSADDIGDWFNRKNLMIGDNVTKPVENYEQLIQRFTKRTMQLTARQDEIKGWYEELC